MLVEPLSKGAAVPMVDLTLPADALDDDTRADLVQKLLATLLRWEGAPEGDRAKSLAWAFVHLADAVVVAHSPSGRPHYRVEVATPQGALDDERRAGLVADVTDLVLAAEGTANTPEDAFRVWVILREVAEGAGGPPGASGDSATSSATSSTIPRSATRWPPNDSRPQATPEDQIRRSRSGSTAAHGRRRRRASGAAGSESIGSKRARRRTRRDGGIRPCR